MLGGFTFNGIHSSTFGVRYTPTERVLSPLKRRNLIDIPGRSSSVIQEDGSYNSRVERILCSYARQEGVTLHRQVRLIAGWLDGVGQLSFDDEPEMHYNAYLSSPPPTVNMLDYATFDLEFTYNHPFAFETAQQKTFDILSGSAITIETDGTVKTPIRIIITNTGTQPIRNLLLTSKFIQN